MKLQVNIIALVDVIGALSGQTLGDGNLGLVDDSEYDSTGRGTPELCTLVTAGQVVQWSALAVDVQTPLIIKDLVFLGADGAPVGALTPQAGAGGPEAAKGQENPDALVWSGVIPYGMVPGVPYRYRLDLQMGQGDNSVLSIDASALMCL